MSDSKQRQRRMERDEKDRQRQRNRAKLRAKVVTFDHPVLSQVSEDLIRGNDLSFIDTMKKVLRAFDTGVGLAANQLAIAKRAIVIDPLKNGDIKALVNPVIIEQSPSVEFGDEGCLSYPNVTAKIERPTWIKVQYYDENFVQHVQNFVNFDARVICHEIDHLNGICRVGEKWKFGDVTPSDLGLAKVFGVDKNESH